LTAKATLAEDARVARVTWADGASRDVSARWLFDHADDARDRVSGQRAHGALALEAAHRIETAVVEGGVLTLRFASGAERRIALAALRLGLGEPTRPVEHWARPGAIAAAAPVPFKDYLGDQGARREALSRVRRWGVAFLSGAGREPGAVERAVEAFGFVRETNYGRTFDVRIEPKPGNLAYTDRALDLHTDNPYRDPIPTVQLLHAIVADAVGGETVFVDGFAHAEALRREAPDAFERLARTPVRFSFADASGARWSCQAPVLGVTADDEVEVVRLNHRSLDLAHGDAAAVDAWYDAYLAYYRRLHEPGAAYGRRLAPGEMVIFDNRRIVHGRRALASDSPRWLQGCYADMDGLAATLARLDRTHAEALTHVG
jgi:alpha-ketoglutarate-dependent taurine dioxygenase